MPGIVVAVVLPKEPANTCDSEWFKLTRRLLANVFKNDRIQLFSRDWKRIEEEKFIPAIQIWGRLRKEIGSKQPVLLFSNNDNNNDNGNKKQH